MNEEDYYPLMDAIEQKDVVAVESFLQTPGIDVDFVSYTYREYYTPLNLAIHNHKENIVEVLLAHGAAVNGPDGAHITPLQQARDKETADENLVELLLDHGADVDAMTDYKRETPFTVACCNPHANLDIIQLLLNAGADANGGDGEIAPLHWTALYCNTEAIELLIEAGADVNILSTREYHVIVHSAVAAGSTPLHWAVFKDFENLDINLKKVTCVTTLLAAGADPNIANAEGKTPLHVAVGWSFGEVTIALLAGGSDPLHQDNHGRTPLRFCYEDFYEVRGIRDFSADEFNIITALVAAGDRLWQCVPRPCPGLEAAMLSVWQAAPDELPELVKHMENSPQNLIELYVRMNDEEMKKVVQEVLRGLHRHYAGFPHLKDQLLKAIFGFTTI